MLHPFHSTLFAVCNQHFLSFVLPVIIRDLSFIIISHTAAQPPRPEIQIAHWSRFIVIFHWSLVIGNWSLMQNF